MVVVLKSPLTYCSLYYHRTGKPFGSAAVKDLRQYPANQINVLSARSIDPDQTSATAAGVMYSSAGGRHCVTVQDYASRCASERPHAVIAMADEVNYAASKKRSRRAIELTQQWFRALRSHAGIPWEHTYCFGVLTAANFGRRDDSVEICKAMVDQGAQGRTFLLVPATFSRFHLLMVVPGLFFSPSIGFVIAGYAQGEGYELKKAAVGIAREACALVGPQVADNAFLMVRGVADISQVLTT